MVSGGFVRCCECDAIHRVSRFDTAPSNGGVRVYGSVETPDDWRLFLERHGEHKLESLHVTREINQLGMPNPDEVRYLEASNGNVRYLLARFRKAAEEPFTYHVLAGSGGGAAPG